jgi:hypothetical protein
MRYDRLEFTRQYAHWGSEGVEKVMFSDESHTLSCTLAIGVFTARSPRALTGLTPI